MKTPIPEDETDGNGAHERDTGIEEGIVEDGLEVSLHVETIQVIEILEILPLPVEDLDDPHPRDVLLEVGIHSSKAGSDQAIGFPHPCLEEEGGSKEEGDDGEGDEGEFPVEVDHHDEDSQEGEEIPEDGNDTRGKGFIQVLYIPCETGHEATHRSPVEESEMEALDVTEEGIPQIHHHPLSHRLGEEGLTITEEKDEEEETEVEKGNPIKPPPLSFLNIIVNGNPREVWTRQLEEGDSEKEDNRENDEPLIWLEVCHHPPHEAGIISLS